jgi:hypothetical protein
MNQYEPDFVCSIFLLITTLFIERKNAIKSREEAR